MSATATTTTTTTRSTSPFSQIKEFLGYLSTVKGDLSNITAPPAFLSPRSVTEIPATWSERQELFLAPAFEEDPEQRALLVLKNFLCSLKRQGYYDGSPTNSTPSSISSTPRSSVSLSRTSSPGSDVLDARSSSPGARAPRAELGGIKKPLNAFLGELFLATFPPLSTTRNGSISSSNGSISAGDTTDDDAVTHLIVEQVSHHPPATACITYNKAHGMSSEGYVAQETSFSPTSGVRVSQIGHAIIRDRKHSESHLMTLPSMLIKGLLTGKPYPELDGSCYISSSSGYLATIEFTGKNAFGMGTRNAFTAKLTNVREDPSSSSSSSSSNPPKPLNKRKPVFEVSGQWTGKITVKSTSTGKIVEEFDVDDIPVSEIQIAPVEKQSPWESRRAWKEVIDGIKANDMAAISKRKDMIEKAQRRMREAERGAGLEWPRMFFQCGDNEKTAATAASSSATSENGDGGNGRFSANAAEYKVLARAIPDESLKRVDPKRTGGVWTFVGLGVAERILRDGLHFRSLEPTSEIAV